MKIKFVQAIMNEWLNKDVNYKRIIKLLLCIFFGALLTFYIKPQLAKNIIKFLFVAKPGRFLRNMHESKLPFKYKLYLWNVTNPNEIAAGTENPKLQEVGPYVFHEFKQKVYAKDNHSEDTVSYNVWSSYIFSPELSAPLTGNEVVTLPNMVITTGIVKVHSESPHLLNVLIEAMDIFFKKPSSIFVTMKAIDFIDTGIEIDCNHTAISTKLVCAEMRRSNLLTIMNDEKTLLRFRWFDSIKNDSIQARYTVMRGSKNIRDVGRVIAINEKPMKIYKQHEKCNLINGTDTMYFPPFQKKDEVLWGFSDTACKSFPIRFKHKKRVHGVNTAYKYVHFSDPLLDPACECNEFSGCAVAGTLDLYQCLGMFVSVSSPHYFSADPSIRDKIDGMHPNENLHETGCYMDLQLGIPLAAHQRVQVNILTKRVPEYRIFSNISGDIWLPLLWYEESFDIEKADLAKVIGSKVLQTIGVGIGYVLMAIGTVGCATKAGAILYHYIRDRVTVKPTTGQQVQTANEN